MSYDPTKVAFVDLETTGLDPERHNVWEIAVIEFDPAGGWSEHVWQQRLPERWVSGVCTEVWRASVSPWVVENTRLIADYDRETALDPHESIERFASLTRGRHLVGACPWFDSERLHRVWLSTTAPGGDRGLPWHYHLIDVETLMVGHLLGMRDADGLGALESVTEVPLPWDSRELSKAAGVDPDLFLPAHTALTDARWARACFEAVVGAPAYIDGELDPTDVAG